MNRVDSLKKLFGDPVLREQESELIQATARHGTTVVGRMLDENCEPWRLRYYLTVAKEAMEAGARIALDRVEGPQDVDSSVPIGLRAKLYDARNSRGGLLQTPPRDVVEQEKLKRLEEYAKLIEALVELSESDNRHPMDVIMMKTVFFYSLSSSRQLGGVVARSVHKKRLPDDTYMLPAETKAFFDRLNELTNAHFVENIDSKTYLAELTCAYSTGMTLAQGEKMKLTTI